MPSWITVIALAAWPALILYPAMVIANGTFGPWRWGEYTQRRLINSHVVLAGMGALVWLLLRGE